MPAISSPYFFFSSDGLIWFSTAKGLTSYDGSQIVYHSSQDQVEEFDLTSINTMAEDRNNNIYIGTDKSLIFYNRALKIFSEISVKDPITGEKERLHVKAIYIDGLNQVFAGRISRGILRYNPESKTSTSLNLNKSKPTNWSDFNYNTIRCISPHATNNSLLWIGTNYGIFQFDKKTQQFSRNFDYLNPPDYKYKASVSSQFGIHKMEIMGDSIIYFNTYSSGFGKYNVINGKATLYLQYSEETKNRKEKYSSYAIRGFIRLDSSNYFVGIHNPNPVSFNTASGQIKQLRIQPGIFHNDEVDYVGKDKDGNIWVLNRGQLFASIPANSFFQKVDIRKQITPDFTLNEIHSIVYDNTTHYYYAGIRFSSGVHVFDSNFNFIKIIPSPLFSNNFINNESCTDWITRDGSGRYWTSGLETYVMTKNNNKFEHIDKIFPSLAWMKKHGEFSDLATTNNGDLVFRKYGTGTLFIIDHKTFRTDTVRIPTDNSVSNLTVYAKDIEVDNTNGYLYTNNQHTIVQYKPLNKGIKVVKNKSIFGNINPQNKYVFFSLDNEGRIWILIEHIGIRIIDPLSLDCIDSFSFGKKGLIATDYTLIANGGPGCMILKSNNGLVLYNYKLQSSYLLDNNNGLPSNRITGFTYSNNMLIVGTKGQLSYINLKNFPWNKNVLKPRLNYISASNETIFIDGGSDPKPIINIRHRQNVFTLNFSAPEFFYPERIEYAYMFDGLDQKWNFTHSFNRELTYAKLKPGNYVFKLKAQLLGGTWNVEPKEYTINIIPAWWQTNLFKIAVVWLAAGIGFLFLRWRINAVRRQEKFVASHEKQLLELESKALRAQMNPHFIFNSLNSIKALINKNENDIAASYLTTFSKLIRTLFQNSNKREVSLFDELETCKHYTQLEKMRFGNKVEFVFSVEESLDLKDIRVPALILQPFIENAIWHGLVPKETNGTVTIAARNINGAVECIIDDDGIGRELSKQFKAQYESTHESKGIGLTQSRLELDKMLNEREDSFEIIDKKNPDGSPAGTTVIITFKENEYDQGIDN